MTKFDELCTAYEESRKQINDYVMSCENFIDRFISGYAEYLGCSKKEFKYDSFSFKLDKIFFYFSFNLKFYENDDVSSKGEHIYKFIVDTSGDNWKIKFNIEIKELKKEFSISKDTFAGSERIYDFVFSRTKEYLENRMKNLSGDMYKEQKIGFGL